MVAQGIVEPSAVAPSSDHRAATPLERTRVLVDARDYVAYPSYEDVRRDRLERKQSKENCKRPSPWWFPHAIPRLMPKCPDCPTHFPSYYFAEWHEHRGDEHRTICVDCQAAEFQVFLYRLMDWEDPDRIKERFGYSTSSSSSAFAAQELDRRYEAITEMNLTEDTLMLMNEISHFKATGELAEPVEISTVDLQFRHVPESN